MSPYLQHITYKYSKWYITSNPRPHSGLEVPLSQITLHNYLLEIHHGGTLWFQGKRTNRLGVNVNPIINRLVAIFQILNQMWITMEKNLILNLLCDFRSLGLFRALRKPFAKGHFFHWWHETPHMLTSRTFFTNQHDGGS